MFDYSQKLPGKSEIISCLEVEINSLNIQIDEILFGDTHSHIPAIYTYFMQNKRFLEKQLLLLQDARDNVFEKQISPFTSYGPYEFEMQIFIRQIWFDSIISSEIRGKDVSDIPDNVLEHLEGFIDAESHFARFVDNMEISPLSIVNEFMIYTDIQDETINNKTI